MLSRQYVRAEYDEDRGAYVSVDAESIDGEPSLAYGFILKPAGDNPALWKGCLEKVWWNSDGNWDSEVFIYATYNSEDAFDADIAQIIQEARNISADENIDEFLAVIDIVKQRAVTMGYEKETIKELEGLFHAGPEDAYTLNDIGDGPRLHDHVQCEDECWYLYTASVVDTEKQPLGWGLFAIHLPDLSITASYDEIKQAAHARILLLDHLHTKRDAKLAQNGFEHFMENERVDDPEYAYMNDTEVVEGAAVNAEWDNEISRVIWQEFDSEAFHGFLNGTAPFVYPRAKWKPGDKSLVDRFFDAHPQPVWLEDQLRAALEEQTGVEPDIDEDNPWQALDLE